MTDINELKKLLAILPDIEKNGEALVKIVYVKGECYHDTEITGNQKGLLRLAKGALKAAIGRPKIYNLVIYTPNESENYENNSVDSIALNEHLEFKEREDGHSHVDDTRGLFFCYRCIIFVLEIGYTAIMTLFHLVPIFFKISVVVGIGTVAYWIYSSYF